jgi:eukaryotic translation initiation factor 2C
VNTKLGGTNHLFNDNAMQWLREKTTLILGADVTHPSPASAPGMPSIVAVVASVDQNFVQYPASLCIQQPDPTKESKEVCRPAFHFRCGC